MEARTVSETLGFPCVLTQLIARDFIAFSRRERLRPYMI
jgi:hypothetical protein